MDLLKSNLQKVLNNDSYLRYYDLEIDINDNSLMITGNVSLYHHKQILNHLIFDFLEKNKIKLNFENNVTVKSSDFTK